MASAVILSQQLAETCSRCVAFFQASPAYETLLEKVIRYKLLINTVSVFGFSCKSRVVKLVFSAV